MSWPGWTPCREERPLATSFAGAISCPSHLLTASHEARSSPSGMMSTALRDFGRHSQGQGQPVWWRVLQSLGAASCCWH